VARPVLAVALTCGAWLLTPALAHGTFIRGSVTVVPDPPSPGRPMVLTVDLANPSNSPVEGAKLVAELTPKAATVGAGARTFPLQEYKEPYGTYRAQFTAPPAGSYTLSVHDRTEPGEDTTATVPLRVGGNVANGTLGFTLAGAAGGSGGPGSWLLWLIVVPVAAGLAVTVLVWRSRSREAEVDGAHQDRGDGRS